MHRPLFNETKQKILSVLIVTLGAFLGFQAISIALGWYQLNNTLNLAFYIYFFHVFWLTFLFDLHLKKRGVLANAKMNHQGLRMLWKAFLERCEHMRHWPYFRHYLNYLVLPGVLYWATVVILFLNPFRTDFKQFIILCSTIVLGVAYWYMKEHVSHRLEAHDHWLKILSVVKLFAAFLSYSSLIGISQYFGYGADFLAATTSLVTFLLFYQAIFQHGHMRFEIFVWLILITLFQTLVVIWVYFNWNAEYLTAGIIFAATHNLFWGILHHHMDKTLSRKVAVEYLLMAVVVISFLFASHNFTQRIN